KQRTMLIVRKVFLKEASALLGASMISTDLFANSLLLAKPKMQLGFVTYLWGKDWDLPTIIRNCTDTKIHGVELRVEHAHKVKPNGLHKEVPVEKTLEQIGKSLHELAGYAADLGQQLRLEVHGEQTQELPNIRKIMEYADHKNAKICWNCNPQDLNGAGFQS